MRNQPPGNFEDMNDKAEPFSMTVYLKPEGAWWVRLTDDRGNIEDKGPIGWKGEGTFHGQGLDSVVFWIPKGYAYQNWQESEDGSYTAVLYRKHPGFD